MIYFVDEDISYVKQLAIPLILRGYGVEILPNADQAFSCLTEATDVEIAVIDIMLATADRRVSRFKSDETEAFFQTGLVLIEHLKASRPEIFPAKCVVLTAATDRSLIEKIRTTCGQMNVPVLDKGEYTRPSLFADNLVKLMRGG